MHPRRSLTLLRAAVVLSVDLPRCRVLRRPAPASAPTAGPRPQRAATDAPRDRRPPADRRPRPTRSPASSPSSTGPATTPRTSGSDFKDTYTNVNGQLPRWAARTPTSTTRSRPARPGRTSSTRTPAGSSSTSTRASSREIDTTQAQELGQGARVVQGSSASSTASSTSCRGTGASRSILYRTDKIATVDSWATLLDPQYDGHI